MYNTVLALHSLTRWLVLGSLVLALFCAYRGWLLKKTFSKTDDLVRIISAAVAHLQLVLGLTLYFISPIVSYFLHNFKTAVHERSIRFFGMEHITMMLIAITLITIGSAKTKRKLIDEQKFKTWAIWYTVALVIIFLSIPWAFSPFTSRPYYRPL